MAASFEGSPAINAALIAAAQKIEHYEMATYGCLHEWANLLGNRKAAGLLQEILNEEGATNKELTALARADSNKDAMEHAEKDKSQGKHPLVIGLPLCDGNRLVAACCENF